MLNLTFLDSEGKEIKEFTQWDQNRSLEIRDSGFVYTPKFHFSNEKSREALTVEASLVNGIVTCDVPNSLLREPYDIVVYVYYSDDVRGKTVFIKRIPIIKKPRPSDVYYADDKNVVSILKLIDELKVAMNSKVDEETVDNKISAALSTEMEIVEF